MKMTMEQALDDAYDRFVAGCEARNAATIWSYQEWLDGSIIAASIRHEYWTPTEDGEMK